MNELIVMELRIDLTELTPDEQALLAAFIELPLERLLPYLCVLLHWERASPSQKAIVLKLLNPELSSKDVARLSGLSDRQLRRYPQYQTLLRLQREQGEPPPRGVRRQDGSLEAWTEEA
jgi:hypothetical protein